MMCQKQILPMHIKLILIRSNGLFPLVSTIDADQYFKSMTIAANKKTHQLRLIYQITVCFLSSGREIRTLDTTGMNRVLWPTELFRHI